MLHAKFQNHRPSDSGEKKITGFCCLLPWRPSWSCDLDHLYKLVLPLPNNAPQSLALIGQAVLEMMMFEYYGHALVYSPRAGADNPLGTKILNLQFIYTFPASFALQIPY